MINKTQESQWGILPSNVNIKLLCILYYSIEYWWMNHFTVHNFLRLWNIDQINRLGRNLIAIGDCVTLAKILYPRICISSTFPIMFMFNHSPLHRPFYPRLLVLVARSGNLQKLWQRFRDLWRWRYAILNRFHSWKFCKHFFIK